jgi:hypothetical protein
LPLTIAFTKHFRAAFLADRPYVEIEHESVDVALRVQAAFEDVRLFPPSAIQLTPSLVVRRVYATQVLGDQLALGFELPKGLTLTAPLPALARPCKELDPSLHHMITDHVPWCELDHRMLRADRDVALFDIGDTTQLGTIRVDTPTIVGVLEQKGKRAKITLTPPKRDTMLTAWIDASHLGEAVRDACKLPQPPPRSDARGWICETDTPLTFVDPAGKERVVGFTRAGRFTFLDKNVCGRDRAGDLLVEHCYAGDPPPGPGQLVVKHFADHCQAAGP